ncbi:hypothetical protein HPB47_023000 [Ixodes persulcatus]|uniref:Uncharacterized protein n=1 Tax=Ixodes persulcatus TaxID=34615 RepID=A0AC60QA69_IXOPE|nr:hypothetical protein HPB47_023000 [Ixodes persulcatus]
MRDGETGLPCFREVPETTPVTTTPRSPGISTTSRQDSLVAPQIRRSSPDSERPRLSRHPRNALSLVRAKKSRAGDRPCLVGPCLSELLSQTKVSPPAAVFFPEALPRSAAYRRCSLSREKPETMARSWRAGQSGASVALLRRGIII